MTNPTGAENAQVQDDANERAREIWRAMLDENHPDAAQAHIARALREAEQAGMMRARDIAMAIDSGRGNEAEIARAIERAAKDGK